MLIYFINYKKKQINQKLLLKRQKTANNCAKIRNKANSIYKNRYKNHL